MMTANRWQEKLVSRFRQYKYPALLLLIGFALVLWPGGKTEEQQSAPVSETESLPLTEMDYCAQMERRLEEILSKIDGVGRVRVMLTLRSGPSTEYQSDLDASTQTDGDRTSTATQQKTVMISRGASYNEAAVVKTEYPRFLGALIVSEGGADAAVRLQITSAVSALLGLGTDKITVVKMK